MITYSVLLNTLKKRKTTRLFGNPELFEIVKTTYEKSAQELKVPNAVNSGITIYYSRIPNRE